MGVCQNIPKIRTNLKANNINNRKNKNKLDSNSEILSDKEYNQFPNINKNIQDTEDSSKTSSLYIINKFETTPTNISSNSTCVQTIPLNKPQYFTIEATIGEIEIPIMVEKNEKIIIKLNQNNENNNKINISEQNMWSFLKDEKAVNYLGYKNHKYKRINLGALYMRITGDKKIYSLEKLENHIIPKEKGNLLFYAHLDLNDYLIYEPKGSISICIIGGNYIYDNDLYFSYNINCFSNNNKNNTDSKEYKIFNYINKARSNIKKFYIDYYNINDAISDEFKEFVNNSNNKRKELKMNKELNELAEKHCQDLCDNETAGHIGTDGQDLKNRFKNFDKCYFYGENIIYNINNPLFIVKTMLQDKYSKKKKNRNNLFFNKFNKVGICLKEHPIYKFCCVIVFSE